MEKDSTIVRRKGAKPTVNNVTTAVINVAQHGDGYTFYNNTHNDTNSNSGETSWTVNWYIFTFVCILLCTFVIFTVIRRNQQKLAESRKEAEYIAYFHSIFPRSKIYSRDSYDVTTEHVMKLSSGHRQLGVFASLEKLAVFFKRFKADLADNGKSSDNPEPSTDIELKIIQDVHETKAEIGNEQKVYKISKHSETSTAASTSCSHHSREASRKCDGKTSNVSLEDRKASNVSLQDGKASNVSLKDGKASNVGLEDRKASNVSLEDRKASNVSLEDGKASNVSLEDRKASNVG